MRGMKKAKQTTITCFCGEEIVLGVQEKDLSKGPGFSANAPAA